MSRIAYIISAYKDAPHLARLVAALEGDADFYVHVDLNADIAPFRAALDGKVTFVPRHRVSWGGWEQVAYQQELLGAVCHSGVAYDRVVCLSAQDYPLWTRGEIAAYFEHYADTEFIMGYDITACSMARQHHRVTRYHLFRDLPWCNRWLKDKAVVASRWLMKVLPLRKPATVSIGGKAAHVFFGSDYWSLTMPCARYVYDTLCHEAALRRYFRTAFVPSELCVQTIVFNSPFAAHALRLSGDYPGLKRLTPLHHICYGSSIKVFTREDLPELQESGRMFCRKVATGVSDGMVEALAGRTSDRPLAELPSFRQLYPTLDSLEPDGAGKSRKQNVLKALCVVGVLALLTGVQTSCNTLLGTFTGYQKCEEPGCGEWVKAKSGYCQYHGGDAISIKLKKSDKESKKRVQH